MRPMEIAGHKPLLMTPKGSLDAKTKRAIRQSGYIVVETEDGNAIKIIQGQPFVPITVKGIAEMALAVIADPLISDYAIRTTFKDRLYKAAMIAHATGKEPKAR